MPLEYGMLDDKAESRSELLGVDYDLVKETVLNCKGLMGSLHRTIFPCLWTELIERDVEIGQMEDKTSSLWLVKLILENVVHICGRESFVKLKGTSTKIELGGPLGGALTAYHSLITPNRKRPILCISNKKMFLLDYPGLATAQPFQSLCQWKPLYLELPAFSNVCKSPSQCPPCPPSLSS